MSTDYREWLGGAAAGSLPTCVFVSVMGRAVSGPVQRSIIDSVWSALHSDD
jgi:hypothetical protein